MTGQTNPRSELGTASSTPFLHGRPGPEVLVAILILWIGEVCLLFRFGGLENRPSQGSVAAKLDITN